MDNLPKEILLYHILPLLHSRDQRSLTLVCTMLHNCVNEFQNIIVESDDVDKQCRHLLVHHWRLCKNNNIHEIALYKYDNILLFEDSFSHILWHERTNRHFVKREYLRCYAKAIKHMAGNILRYLDGVLKFLPCNMTMEEVHYLADL